MSAKLKACPFCGAHLKKCVFDKKMFYEHPDVNGCALSQMLFTEKQWNTRPVEEALEARIAELEAETVQLKVAQRWVDVKKQMPKVPIVLVARKDGSVGLDSTYSDGGRDYWYNSGIDNVTHWMPLPEPPEEDEPI